MPFSAGHVFSPFFVSRFFIFHVCCFVFTIHVGSYTPLQGETKHFTGACYWRSVVTCSVRVMSFDLLLRSSYSNVFLFFFLVATVSTDLSS